MELKKLSPAALKAAMSGGTEAWGRWGSIERHIVYIEPQPPRRGQYCKCHCGCGGKARFQAKANGVGVAQGCELSMRRFAAHARARADRG